MDCGVHSFASFRLTQICAYHECFRSERAIVKEVKVVLNTIGSCHLVQIETYHPPDAPRNTATVDDKSSIIPEAQLKIGLVKIRRSNVFGKRATNTRPFRRQL